MIPIHHDHQSSSIFTTSQHISNTHSLISLWKEWAEQALPGAGERRDAALFRLTECLQYRTDTLNLQDLNLTELPTALPDHIKTLYVSYNQLTSLPETLPPRLETLYANNNQLLSLPEALSNGLKILYVENNQLTTLPVTLPNGLEVLKVINNQLTSLPETLPPEIEALYVSNNQLTRLPEILPTGIKQLFASNNRLTHLPETLPNGIQELYANNNHLTQLPQTLPSQLRILYANHNQLTQLPRTLPSQLRILYANHNQLTQLPRTLPDELRLLDVSYNQLTDLSDTIRPGLINLIIDNNPLFTDPLSLLLSQLSMMRGINNSSNPPLIKALRAWDKTRDIKQWEKIAKEENADHFSHFLNKLHKQRNAANAPLHRIVSEWLTQLAKEENREIRAQTFAIAQLGSESCVDRASYYFNQMHSLLIEHHLTKPSVPISEIINTLRSLFRLQELEKISADHAEQRRRTAPGFTEDIEIYLAYQYKLKDELALPVHTELQFETLANLTQADIEKAKRQILKTEQEEFLRHLVTHSKVWEKKIEAWDGQKWALANEGYLDEIASDDFQQTVEEALKSEGISKVDEDAMRIMQQKLASDRLFQMRYPLTEAFLKEQNALSLIDGMHP